MASTSLPPRRLGTADWAAVSSLASLLGVVPHVIEDVLYSAPARLGLSSMQAQWLFGSFVTIQALAALGALRRRRGALLVLLSVAVIWVVAAVLEHHRAFLPGEFRAGLASRLWVWLLIICQASAAVLAGISLRRRRQGPSSETTS